MKRFVSLITALTLALQSSGLAVSAGIGQGQSATNPLTLNEASRITSRYEGPTIGGVTTTFGYDDIGQLTSESSAGYSASYAYDANGNRTNRTVNGLSETYTVDDADKLTSVAWSVGLNNYQKVYAYHYSGRPTSITYKTNGVTTATETMTWDKESRMLTNSLANASYAYNGFDARVSKTVGGNTTTFKRAGADPVSPVLSDVVGATTTRYLPGISSNVGGTSTFNHSGIKNGILQTNSSQSNTATKRYDAFGDDPTTTGPWQTRFDYGGAFGYQKDSESDYKLLGHRYYDPEVGRFLTRDPVKDGRNWYSYCENMPTNCADPEGEELITIILIVGAAVLTGAGIVVFGTKARKISADGRANRKLRAFHTGEIDFDPDAYQRTNKPMLKLLEDTRQLALDSARQHYGYGPMAAPYGSGGDIAVDALKELYKWTGVGLR
jgi:RHS repeat-associated protein